MSSLEQLQADRVAKISILESAGINPYPAAITLSGERVSSQEAKHILEKNEGVSESENAALSILTGRVLTVRGQGKILFVDVSDQTGKLQCVLKIDVLGAESMELFSKVVDAGDFFAFSGILFITNRGEKSLEVKSWQILAKALLPMPSQWYGLENEEEAMRKRYLDFAMNPEKKELFHKKALFWQVVRIFFVQRNFLEVETPTLETTTGGAEARPFKTYHNDFDIDVYMRICVGELWQKRLMAGGFEKTFEIGRAYRNEGSSPEHLQEFTNCEFYMAYADYKDGMKLVRDLYIKIAQEVFGKTEFVMKGHTFNLAHEWPEIDYATEIMRQTGIDIWTATDEEIKDKLRELSVRYDGENRERLTDTLWKYCRKNISGPAFLVNHPLLVAPLAKPNSDGRTAQQFQPIIAGSEVGRGYSELNDSRVQRDNFTQQQKLLDAGDEEAMMPDWEFIEMLEHGMPPTCGFGFGDRLFAFLAGLPIRETQLFPLTKMKQDKGIEK